MKLKEGQTWRHRATGIEVEIVDLLDLDGLVQIFIEKDQHMKARDALVSRELFLRFHEFVKE